MFRAQFRLTGDRVPNTRIEIDVFNGGQILNYDYRNALKAGDVKDIHGEIDHFTKEGVVLKDGSKMEADLVVYGTGFTKEYDYFDKETMEKLDR